MGGGRFRRMLHKRSQEQVELYCSQFSGGWGIGVSEKGRQEEVLQTAGQRKFFCQWDIGEKGF